MMEFDEMIQEARERYLNDAVFSAKVKAAVMAAEQAKHGVADLHLTGPESAAASIAASMLILMLERDTLGIKVGPWPAAVVEANVKALMTGTAYVKVTAQVRSDGTDMRYECLESQRVFEKVKP